MNDNLSEALRQVLEFVHDTGGSVRLIDFDQFRLLDPDDVETVPGLIRDGLLEHEPGSDTVQISEAGSRALARYQD